MEFTISILPQVIENAEFLFRLVLSILIGTVIGKERKRKEKPGGQRTFALICFGACLISILSLKLNGLLNLNEAIVRYDIGRLLAYGIVSIGFLGSGIIIQRDNKVDGLTSASTLWVIVPIGFFIGLGYYFLGIASSILIYLVLESKSMGKSKKLDTGGYQPLRMGYKPKPQTNINKKIKSPKGGTGETSRKKEKHVKS